MPHAVLRALAISKRGQVQEGSQTCVSQTNTVNYGTKITQETKSFSKP